MAWPPSPAAHSGVDSLLTICQIDQNDCRHRGSWWWFGCAATCYELSEEDLRLALNACPCRKGASTRRLPTSGHKNDPRVGRDDSSGCRAWGDPLPCLICFLVFLADLDETAYPKVSQLATVAQVVDVAVRYSSPGGDLGDGVGKLYWRPIRHRCAFSKYAEPKVQVDLLY